MSFVIGHRGIERAPLLLATLASIAAQEGVSLECIVVEQAADPVLPAMLPSWVRHIHTPTPRAEMPYSRSWAFNVGARSSRANCLIFHDNDVLVPRRYAAEAVRVLSAGFEAARLQRFVFHLDAEQTETLVRRRQPRWDLPPVDVLQNCEGHTLVADRRVYWEVGGHDEAFQGWGGEDNEMFDRLKARRLHDHAYLPFVHLYHSPQIGKGARHANSEYFEERLRLDRLVRIRELSRRPSGGRDGPVP